MWAQSPDMRELQPPGRQGAAPQTTPLSMTPPSRMAVLATTALCLAAAHAGTQASAEPPPDRWLAQTDVAELSIEQLGALPITSVSRRQETLAGAAASVFVITADDIRRSGATSLAEVLRLAPNLDVARADTSQYAVSARGSNRVLANKLLVLVDGRTVYSPLFSGVYWEAQELLLADIERIEVISGPGGTLWGTNAVNGVISVTRRSARFGADALVSAGTGTHDTEFAARTGGLLGDAGGWRVYARSIRRDDSRLADGAPGVDAHRGVQAGFRADWEWGRDRLTLQGDATGSDIDQPPEPRRVTGANLLARWSRQFDDGNELRLQAWYDRADRRQEIGTAGFRDRLDTFDLELQHGLQRGRHRFVWGAGYRETRDRARNFGALAFFPQERTLHWSNVFAQDEIELREDLALTLGLRYETNRYVAPELLPTARVAWRVTPEHLLWGALSRAAREPSRFDREYHSPATAPLLRGGPDFGSEIAHVLELGYRGRPTRDTSLSVTLFRQRHRGLASIEPDGSGGFVFGNGVDGRTDGIEAWSSTQLSRRWRAHAGVTLLRQDLRVRPGYVAFTGIPDRGDPRRWWTLRSSFDVTPRHSLDVSLRHVAGREAPAAGSYTALDARLGWQATPRLNVMLALQNLLDDRHVEWPVGAVPVEHTRGAFLRLRWTP